MQCKVYSMYRHVCSLHVQAFLDVSFGSEARREPPLPDPGQLCSGGLNCKEGMASLAHMPPFLGLSLVKSKVSHPFFILQVWPPPLDTSPRHRSTGTDYPMLTHTQMSVRLFWNREPFLFLWFQHFRKLLWPKLVGTPKHLVWKHQYRSRRSKDFWAVFGRLPNDKSPQMESLFGAEPYVLMGCWGVSATVLVMGLPLCQAQ